MIHLQVFFIFPAHFSPLPLRHATSLLLLCDNGKIAFLPNFIVVDVHRSRRRRCRQQRSSSYSKKGKIIFAKFHIWHFICVCVCVCVSLLRKGKKQMLLTNKLPTTKEQSASARRRFFLHPKMKIFHNKDNAFE